MRILLAVPSVLLVVACGQQGRTAVDPPRATPGEPAPTATRTVGARPDEIEGNEPSVALRFTPELPGP